MSNFPQPPHEIGKTHQIGDKVWTWDGEKWFADYDSLVPVFQVKPDEGLVNLDQGVGSDFELALDADTLQELNTPTVLVIGNIIITPSNAAPEVGDTVTYTYTKDGNVGDDIFLDLTCDVPGSIVTGNTIEFTQLGSGTVTMRVESATATDSPATGTLAVTVVPVATTIGTVTITGDANPTQGDTVTYGFTISGDAQDTVGTLTTNISGASVSGDEIEFLQDGSGYVEYEVTSQTSTDSPVVERLNVTVSPLTSGVPFPIIGDSTVTPSGPDVTDPDPVIYNVAGGTNHTWSVEEESYSLGFTTSGVSSDCIISNRYAMFDGSETRPTTFDFQYYPNNNAIVSFQVDTKAFPPGKYKLEALIQETTGDKFGMSLSDFSGRFTEFPSQVCTSPTWVESSREVDWRDGDADGVWAGNMIINNETANSYCRIYAFRALGQIVTFTRATQITNRNDDTAAFRFFNKQDYKVKCNYDDNGINYTAEYDVTVDDYLPLEDTADRTDRVNIFAYDVTVVSTGGGDKYALDGDQQKAITMGVNDVLKFEQYDPSNYANNNRPIRIYTDASKSTEITNGVTINTGLSETYFLPSAPGTYSYQCEFNDDMGGDITVTSTTTTTPPTTYTVTVTSTYNGNKYVIDGVQQDSISLTAGQTYIFDQSDSSNSGHPLRIYTDSSKSTEVTAGVTVDGTTTTFVPASTGTYSYQCSAHAGMGGDIIVT